MGRVYSNWQFPRSNRPPRLCRNVPEKAMGWGSQSIAHNLQGRQCALRAIFCLCRRFGEYQMRQLLRPMKNIAFAVAAVTLGLMSFAAATGDAASGPVFKVKNYGAACDGATDDTAAIQKAINAAEAAGGGVVEFPSGTCLLNTNYPSSHPWFFYNLKIGSNVKLRGTAGAKLLQGSRGRHPLVAGATQVRNTVLAFGLDYTVVRFQQAAYNGGFYGLKATTANGSRVALADPSNASKFKVGDYVALFKTTAGDVIPMEASQLTAVDGATGVLGLKSSLARSFATPVIANVTSLVTTNIGVEDLIVQGAEPLAVTEAFGFTAQNNRFIIDTAVGASNVLNLNCNTLRDFQFIGNFFASDGPTWAGLELTQRNSQNGLFNGNTFIGSNMGFGEYAAHITFTNNHFWIHADPTVVAGVFIGGKDVNFSNNDVHGGNITGGSSWGALLSDFIGPAEYASYVGQIRIANNTFNCQADGNACLGIFAADTSVTGNTITVVGSALGIHAEGPLLQSNTIRGNTFSMGSGDGILIVTPSTGGSGSVITGNTISGSGAHGIYVNAHGAPNAGGITLLSNTITGFGAPVSIH